MLSLDAKSRLPETLNNIHPSAVKTQIKENQL